MNKTLLLCGTAGSGKTTVARHLAIALKHFGYDVLLVDADLSTPKLCHHFNIPLVKRTIQDVLLGKLPLTSALYQAPSGIKLLLAGLAENPTPLPHPATLLPQLSTLADIVIIDTPSRDLRFYPLGTETILVTTPDFPSILDTKKLTRQTTVNGIILNRAHHDHLEITPSNARDIIGKKILGTIPEEPRMRETIRNGYSLLELYPDNPATASINQIAANLMNLEYHPPRKSTPLLVKLGILP